MVRTGKRPIFIVGSPRSGTTLLRLVLDSHSRISCGPETQFLKELEPIVGRRWEAMSRYGFDRDYWFDKIAALHASPLEEYARRRGKVRWADKTPKYGRHLSFIDELYPDCQVIHVIRNGLDVVASHKERWGRERAEAATYRWRDYILTIREQSRALPASRYMEVRYESLVGEPEATIRSVLQFLGEPWEDDILDLDKHEHDESASGEAFRSERRAQGDGDAAVYTSRVGVGGRELDPELRDLFWERSGDLQRSLGY